MARIRTIKPELWEDEGLGRLPRDARLLFIGLVSNADDYGRLRGGSGYVRGRVFPYDEDVTNADVEGLLDALSAAGLIARYDHGGERYILVSAWERHQKIGRRFPSKLPPPPGEETTPDESTSEGVQDKSSTPHGQVVELSRPRAHARKDQGSRIKDQSSRARAHEDGPGSGVALAVHDDPVLRIIGPFGLNGPQRTIARNIATEHGIDVLVDLAARARGPAVIDPTRLLASWLKPESDELVSTVARLRHEREQHDEANGYADRLIAAIDTADRSVAP